MAKQTFTTGQVLTAAQMTSLQQTAMGGGSATAKTTSYVLTAADAGTTVIMNAAGATTITVNTALFAAGDTVNIQNIGAGTCTITAGTATVNTAGSLAMVQYEGGVLYFVSTSVATYFDYFQGSSTPTFKGCSLQLTSSTSVSNGTQTVVDFTTELFDTDAFHDNSTNPSRITAPAGLAGKYLMIGSSGWANASSATDRGIRVTKNGSVSGLPQVNWQTSASGVAYMNISTVVNLSVGDYCQVEVIQYNGGSLTLQAATTFFQAIYLGA